MSSNDLIGCRREGAVATLTLQRPAAANALNIAMRSALLAAMRYVEQWPGVRVVVLDAQGAGFSAGNDLKEPLAHASVEALILEEYAPLLEAMAHSSRLYVAAVQGVAAGVGMSLALGCDLLWMADDACLYPAFAPIGLVPDGGATWQLVQAMGQRRALAALIEGRRIGAAECVALGLANGCCPAAELPALVQQRATDFAALAPLAVQHTKRLARAAVAASFAQTLRDEAAAQNLTYTSRDCREAVAAFFERRPPVFEGR